MAIGRIKSNDMPFAHRLLIWLEHEEQAASLLLRGKSFYNLGRVESC